MLEPVGRTINSISGGKMKALQGLSSFSRYVHRDILSVKRSLLLMYKAEMKHEMELV